MKSRILATAVVAVALAVGVATPAFATGAYTGGLNQNSSAPGGTLTYTSENTGEPAGTPATFSLSGPTTATATTSAAVTHTAAVTTNGRLSFSVAIPKDAKPGSTFKLNVNSGTFADAQKISIIGVLAPAAAAFNAVPLVVVAAVVLILALLLVLILVRRRAAANAAA